LEFESEIEVEVWDLNLISNFKFEILDFWKIQISDLRRA